MKKLVALVTVLHFACAPSFAHTLKVPFFRDDADVLVDRVPETGSAGFVGIQNTTGNTIVMHVVYTQNDLDGEPIEQAARPFTLMPQMRVSWRPATDDPIENLGQAVPNTFPGFDDTGSIEIVWKRAEGGPTALMGRYLEMTRRNAFAHVLLE